MYHFCSTEWGFATYVFGCATIINSAGIYEKGQNPLDRSPLVPFFQGIEVEKVHRLSDLLTSAFEFGIPVYLAIFLGRICRR